MSRAVHLILAPLTFLGRHGTLAIALSLLGRCTALPFSVSHDATVSR
jgi:hypothetical protein